MLRVDPKVFQYIADRIGPEIAKKDDSCKSPFNTWPLVSLKKKGMP